MAHGRKRSRPEAPAPIAATVAPAPAPAPGVLASLRQRKVVQWTLAYAAAAFALLQALQLVGSAFGWAPWTIKAGVVVAGLGGVATAVVSWYHGDRGAQRVGGTELLILTGLLVAGAAFLWHLRVDGTAAPGVAPAVARPATRPGEAVVAVLPFDNLGPASDGGFVDGLHDETISRLASMGGFAVISRTSTLGYRQSRPNLRTLAAELGATHVLEGTVQRDGDHIRLRVQFIDAGTDAHLFARNIDREGARLFEAQALLAVEIAEALRTELRPDAVARLERQPTPSAEAYAAYLQARRAWLDGDLGIDVLADDDPDAHLDRALALDAGFVEALAMRAVYDAEFAFAGEDLSVRPARSRAALAQLQRIAPEHPLTWLAEGKVRYHVDLDYEAAAPPLQRAAAAMPNDPIALNALAWLQARRGHSAEANALIARLARLDPRSVRVLVIQGLYHELTGNYAALIDVSDRALALDPGNADLQYNRAFARRLAFGDLGPTRAQATKMRLADGTKAPGVLRALGLIEVDDYPGALSALDGAPEEMRFGVGGFVPPSDLVRAHCLHRLGDRAGAKAAARRGLALLATAEPPRLTEGVMTVLRGHLLGLAGQRDEGLAEVARGRALAVASGDAIVAGQVDANVIVALIDLEDLDGAATVARDYMDRPFPRLSPGDLLALPLYSPLLRQRPEFRAEVQQRLDRQVAAFPQSLRDAYAPASTPSGEVAP
jgi:serine/threonine-protein kinase